MTKKSYDYAWQRCFSAVRCLICDCPMEERLVMAGEELVVLEANDFPEGLRSEFQSIREELADSKYDSEVPPGAGLIAYTVHRMEEETRSRLAERIHSLSDQVSRLQDF